MDNGPLVSRGGGSDIICRTEAMAETKDDEEQKDERVQAELERRNKARTVSMRGFPKSLSRSRSGFIPREKEHYDPEEDEEAKEVKDEAEEVEEEDDDAEERNNKKDPKTKLGLLLTRSGGLDLAKRKKKILLRKKPQHATISSSSLSTPTSPSLYRFSSEDASLRKLATSSPPTSSSSPQFKKTNSTSPTSSSISSSSSYTSISSSPSSPSLPSSPAQTSTTASCSVMGSNSGHFRRLKTAFQLAKTNHSKQASSSSSPSSPRSVRRTSKSMELKLNNNSTNIISSRDSNSNSPSTSPPSSPIRFSSSSTSAFSSSDPSSVISSSSSTKKERYSKRRSFPFPIFRSPFKDSSSNNSTHNRAVTRNQKVMSFRFAQIREEDLEVEPHPIACGAFGMVYKGKWLGTVECAIKKMVLPVPSSSTNSSTVTSSLSVLSPTPQPKTSPESRKKVSQLEDAERDKEEKKKDEEDEAEDPLIQFKLEATLLEKVGRHPNVVTFYGALIQGHQVSLVMEYARLGSLHDLLHLPTGRSRPASSTYSPSATSPVLTQRHRQQQKHNQQGWGVPFPVLIKLLMEAANGILFLHHHQIIHRDIAARNVLVQGPYYTALITDFGLSRVVAQNCWGDVSKSGLGPVGHMAPEAITKQQYSEKSDAWSFGVMLWEVVARKKPWRGIPLLEVAKLVGTQGRSLPIPGEEDGRDEDEEDEEEQEERKKRRDPVLCGLMRRCFQRDPALRPSFQEIHRTLEDYYQALTEMRPPSPSLFFSNSSVALPVTSSNLRRKHHQQQNQRIEEDDDDKEEDGEDELDLRGTSTSVATRQEIAKDGYVLQDWNILEDDFEIAGKAQEEITQVEKEKEETEMEKETESDLDEQEEMRSSMVMKRVAELEQRCRTRKESASYRLVRMKDTNTRNEENEQQNEEQSGEEKQKEERGKEEEKRKEERGGEGEAGAGEIEAIKHKKVEMIKESKRRASTYDERSSKEKVSNWQRSAAPTTDSNSNNTSHTRRQKRILSCKATIGERQHLPGQ
ncbi:Serine threonine tyrosine kinase 1 [Balamuthia mandrillaris]